MGSNKNLLTNVLLLALAMQASCTKPPSHSECSLFSEPTGSAEVAYSKSPENRGLKVSITNSGYGPLCFFARDRLFASDIYLHDKGGNEVSIQYPDTDRPWHAPLANRMICIPPGSEPVRQEFQLRVGQEIQAIPKGEYRLSFKLIAFGPYVLAIAKPDHSIGNGISAQELSCGADQAFTEIRAETQVYVE